VEATAPFPKERKRKKRRSIYRHPEEIHDQGKGGRDAGDHVGETVSPFSKDRLNRRKPYHPRQESLKNGLFSTGKATDGEGMTTSKKVKGEILQ